MGEESVAVQEQRQGTGLISNKHLATQARSVVLNVHSYPLMIRHSWRAQDEEKVLSAHVAGDSNEIRSLGWVPQQKLRPRTGAWQNSGTQVGDLVLSSISFPIFKCFIYLFVCLCVCLYFRTRSPFLFSLSALKPDQHTFVLGKMQILGKSQASLDTVPLLIVHIPAQPQQAPPSDPSLGCT